MYLPCNGKTPSCPHGLSVHNHPEYSNVLFLSTTRSMQIGLHESYKLHTTTVTFRFGLNNLEFLMH